MDSTQFDSFLRGDRISFADSKSTSLEYARSLDAADPLAHFRSEFLIPSKADLKDAHPEANPINEQNGTSSLPLPRTELTPTPQIHPTPAYTSAETRSVSSPVAPAPC